VPDFVNILLKSKLFTKIKFSIIFRPRDFFILSRIYSDNMQVRIFMINHLHMQPDQIATVIWLHESNKTMSSISSFRLHVPWTKNEFNLWVVLQGGVIKLRVREDLASLSLSKRLEGLCVIKKVSALTKFSEGQKRCSTDHQEFFVKKKISFGTLKTYKHILRTN
jgi:hypothetical protein